MAERFYSTFDFVNYIREKGNETPFECNNVRILNEDVYHNGHIYRKENLVCFSKLDAGADNCYCSVMEKTITLDKNGSLSGICSWNHIKFKFVLENSQTLPC